MSASQFHLPYKLLIKSSTFSSGGGGGPGGAGVKLKLDFQIKNMQF